MTTKWAVSVCPPLRMTRVASIRVTVWPRVEDDALGFVQGADEIPQLRAENPFEGVGFGPDQVDLAAAPSAQRRGDFEADEAGTDDDGASRTRVDGADDGFAVGPGPQVMHVWKIGTWDGESHGFSAGGEQKRTVGELPAIGCADFWEAVSRAATGVFSRSSMPCCR